MQLNFQAKVQDLQRIHKFHNNLIIIILTKFHNHLRIDQYHLDNLDSMFLRDITEINFRIKFQKLILSKFPYD